MRFITSSFQNRTTMNPGSLQSFAANYVSSPPLSVLTAIELDNEFRIDADEVPTYPSMGT